MERRLAAILSADMAGYSRLMERDEDGVIRRQKAHRREIVDPEILSRNGRIVKTTGDGVLVEFSSAQDAVRCAIDIQSALVERETTISPDDGVSSAVAAVLIRNCRRAVAASPSSLSFTHWALRPVSGVSKPTSRNV